MEGQLGFVFLPIVTPILQRTPSAPGSARRTASVGYKLLFPNQSENKATPLSVFVELRYVMVRTFAHSNLLSIYLI